MSDNNDLEIKISADTSGVSPELEKLQAQLKEARQSLKLWVRQ